MKKFLPFLLLLWACAACWAIHTQRVPVHVMFGGATTTTTQRANILVLPSDGNHDAVLLKAGWRYRADTNDLTTKEVPK